MIFVTSSLDPAGALVVTDDAATRRIIQPPQIPLHRRDPAFEAALQAAKDTLGNLTSADLAKLPAAPVAAPSL
jgi:hypothetical protein